MNRILSHFWGTFYPLTRASRIPKTVDDEDPNRTYERSNEFLEKTHRRLHADVTDPEEIVMELPTVTEIFLVVETETECRF